MLIASRIKRNSCKIRLQNARVPRKNKAPEITNNSCRPVFRFYPENQIDELRGRTLLLLENHGVAIEHDEAGALLRAAGASQSSDGKYYKLPRELVEEALTATPKNVRLYAKDPNWGPGTTACRRYLYHAYRHRCAWVHRC